MMALILLLRIALLSGALWLIGRVARRERLAVRRTAALASLLLIALAGPASLGLPAGLWNLTPTGAASGTGAAVATGASRLWPALGWCLTAVYLAGVGVGLTRFGLGLIRLWRLRLYPAPPAAQRLLRAEIPEPRRPRLYVSSDASLPFSTQIGPGSRGRIVLPAGLIGATDRGTLAAILRHEAGHLAANDPWWSLLSRLTCALFWPVPFVHSLSRELDEIQEVAADQAAVARAPLPQKALYAEYLITLAARPGIFRPVAVVCAAAGRSFRSLEWRIRSILTGAEDAAGSGRRAAVRRRLCNGITALVVLSLPVIFLVGVTPTSTAPRPALERLESQAPAPTLDDQEAALRVPIRFERGESSSSASLMADELRLRAGL